MDNKIIETLDYLGEKIGIAIDWTAENVYPQIMDFMARYKTYEIVTDIIWILIALGCCFSMYLYIKKIVVPAKIRCNETREDNLWFECWSGNINCNIGGTILTVFLGCITLVAVIMMFVLIEDLVKWIVIPEAQFYDILKGVIKCGR